MNVDYKQWMEVWERIGYLYNLRESLYKILINYERKFNFKVNKPVDHFWICLFIVQIMLLGPLSEIISVAHF